jgi:hypothetical protein
MRRREMIGRVQAESAIPALSLKIASRNPTGCPIGITLGIFTQGGGEKEMRAWTAALVSACALMNTGCMTSQLRNHMTEQASSIPGVYYQVVLDNLAMIAADPARMPYFSDPQTAQTSIAQNANVS